MTAINDGVTHITFRRIHPRLEIKVPLEKAWDYYRDQPDGCLDGYGMATISDPSYNGGKPFETFMKLWMVWDFTIQKWEATRFGLGANGDGGPVNPRVYGKPVKQVYYRQPDGEKWEGWVAGINPTNDERTYGRMDA